MEERIKPLGRISDIDQPLRKIYPSPAAVAFVTRLTDVELHDVYLLACKVDEVAEEARTNERARIFKMGFMEIMREMWKGKKLHVRP